VALGQAKVFAEEAAMKVVIADIRQDHLDQAMAYFSRRDCRCMRSAWISPTVRLTRVQPTRQAVVRTSRAAVQYRRRQPVRTDRTGNQ